MHDERPLPVSEGALREKPLLRVEDGKLLCRGACVFLVAEKQLRTGWQLKVLVACDEYPPLKERRSACPDVERGEPGFQLRHDGLHGERGGQVVKETLHEEDVMRKRIDFCLFVPVFHGRERNLLPLCVYVVRLVVVDVKAATGLAVFDGGGKLCLRRNALAFHNLLCQRDCRPAVLLCVYAERAHRHIAEACAARVVEADNPEMLRHLEPERLGVVFKPHRYVIVEADDAVCGKEPVRNEVVKGVIASLFGIRAFKDSCDVHLDAVPCERVQTDGKAGGGIYVPLWSRDDVELAAAVFFNHVADERGVGGVRVAPDEGHELRRLGKAEPGHGGKLLFFWGFYCFFNGIEAL